MTASMRPFRLALSSPLSTGSGTIDERAGFLFRTDEPHSGIGEASPLAGFTEDPEDCLSALSRATAAYGRDGWRGAFAAVSGNPPETPAARHAVSLAYHDSLSKQVEKPLYEHLGGSPDPNPVAVNATIGNLDTEATLESVRTAVAAGFPAIKVKVAVESIEQDVERIRAVAGDVPTDVSLRVDANGAWNRGDAEQFLEETADVELEYVEQPLDATALDAHADLRSFGTPIALDESLARLDVETVLQSDAADVLVLKPMALGGPDVTRAIATAARRNDFVPVLSTTVDSVVARTAAIHVAASLPDLPPSGLGTATLLSRDLALDPAPVENGHVRAPSTPGLGVEEVTIPDD